MYGGRATGATTPVRKLYAGGGGGGVSPWVLGVGDSDLWAAPVELAHKKAAVKTFTEKRVKDGDNSSPVDSIMPLIRLMQVAVVMPVQRKQDGTLMFKWLSPVMVYSLVVFGLLSVPVYYTGSASLRQLLAKEAASFHEQIYNMTPLLLLHSHPLLPVLHWREAKSAAAYFNSWISLETGFLRVTRRPLLLRMRSRVVVWTVSAALFSAGMTATLPLYMTITWWQSLAYFHLFLLTSTLVTVWRLSAMGLSRAAEILRDALHRDVVSGNCSADVISDYRQAWLELSELTQESGRAWTYSCGHQLLYQFLLMTVTSFGVLAGVTRHSLDARTLAYGAVAALSGFTLFSVCSAAENAADKVSQVLRDDLLTAQLSGDDSQQFKNEVQMFMTALAMNPPSVNLSGYATVNRALFASLLETMVTYLVVLVQFAYSLDSPASNATEIASNITSPLAAILTPVTASLTAIESSP